MKLYKFIVLIIALLAIAATATYIITTSDELGSNENTVNNTIKESVL